MVPKLGSFMGPRCLSRPYAFYVVGLNHMGHLALPLSSMARKPMAGSFMLRTLRQFKVESEFLTNKYLAYNILIENEENPSILGQCISRENEMSRKDSWSKSKKEESNKSFHEKKRRELTATVHFEKVRHTLGSHRSCQFYMQGRWRRVLISLLALQKHPFIPKKSHASILPFWLFIVVNHWS